MTNVFKSTWTPRTGLHSVNEKSAEKNPGQSREDWIYTRGIMLRVLWNFPEAMQAIRAALAEVRRKCPE